MKMKAASRCFLLALSLCVPSSAKVPLHGATMVRSLDGSNQPIETQTPKFWSPRTAPTLIGMVLSPWTHTRSTASTKEAGFKPSFTSSSVITSSSMITFPVNDRNGPGINNIPIKPIRGQGKDGTRITFPNKTGYRDCSKKCSYAGAYGIESCLSGLQEKIHAIARDDPQGSYAPLERIACAPHESNFCAFVEFVPWTPLNERERLELAKMDTQPYDKMEDNRIPIGAIKEGMDWIKQNGAKMCGQSLLPVPANVRGHEKVRRGYVYILKADVNYTLPSLDD
ncbi:hypothetical protein MBLNU459_g8534t1 [Dothideomycetes sp. NU459]